MKRLARSVALLAVASGLASVSAAQISPGELSAAHARLEGSRNCLSCHRAGEGVDPALCLDCHRALAERLASASGLHARTDYQACERCHAEHNGREFELIYWPDGNTAFDHRLAGWTLEGRHARLECFECHRAERVAAWVGEREPTKPLDRTFLGQPTACAACHADPHRGAMRSETCTDCHSQESWKSPRAFDHARTRFTLLGAHARTECKACHLPAPDATAESRNLAFDQFRNRPTLPACADCHRDPHAGRLGGDCASCHSNDRFRPARRDRFDHERTAYPLRGKHRGIDCLRCHGPGRELRVAGHDRCESCHRDPHLGQLAASAVGGRCDSCHSVDAFRPARYGLNEHERSRFPLAGAHRAVPCFACHREVAVAELPPPYDVRRSVTPTRKFRLEGQACADCHRDPHAGELARWSTEQGCRACHDQERWRPARFEHERTRFALAGAHSRVACDACHPRGPEDQRHFAGRPLECSACHRDPHADQFALAGVTDCARCHSIERFRPLTGFDHAATRYPLDGRHATVPCAGCHPAETVAEKPVVRYKPRPLDCAGCHATGTASEIRG